MAGEYAGLGPEQGVPAPQGPSSWPSWPGEGPCPPRPGSHSGRARWLLLPDHFITDLAAAG